MTEISNIEETKVCTRCGRTLPIDEFYEVKYKGQKPKYRHAICATCTRIEQRRRRLIVSDPENPQIQQIEELYAKHKAAGRSVPDTTRRSGAAIERDIEMLLNMED